MYVTDFISRSEANYNFKMTTASIMTLNGPGRDPIATPKVRNNTSIERDPDRHSNWSVGKNEKVISMTEPDDWAKWGKLILPG